MKCSSCGFEGEKAWKFCPECGERSSAASSASGVEADVSLGAMRTLPEAPAGAQGGGTEPDVSFAAATMVGPGPAESGASHVGASAPLADRYELLEEIGRGGFAVVWKARDGKMGRIVAIKRLLPEAMTGSGGAQTLARFQREAEAIARLNHRNIVAVYDRGEDERGPYIVMEFVEGGSLRAYAKSKGGKLAVPEAVALVRGVVQGLSFAHRSNLVHRDIKPANILLHLDPSARADSERVVPKIVDFGLARAGGDSELSMSGYGMGTPWYMPPEQRRDAKGVNHTADIYAVGKMLYELVSGDVPDNVDPSKIPPEAGLAEAIFTCIKSNPAERYFSADELLDALDQVGRKGTGKPIPGAVTLKAGENPCPSCGAPNAVDAKFCESCGAGMTRVCPECRRENSVHRQFCSGCGTDVEGFLKWAEALPVMQKYVGEKRWSRVVKEHGLLPQDVKLRGAKGNNLKAECDKLLGHAQTSIQERDQLLAEIRKMKDSGEIVRTLNALNRCLDVDPHQDDIKTLQPIYRKLAEMEKDMASRLDAADFDGAQAALTAMKTAGLPDDSFKSLSLKVRQNRNDFAALSAQVASLGREGRVEAAVKTLGDSLQLWPACASMQAEQARLSERVKTLREHLDGARSAIAVKSWRRALAWSQRAMEIDPAHREASEFRSLAERMIKRNKTKNKIGLGLIAVAIAVYAGATAYSNVQKARHAREAAAKVESLLKEAGEAQSAENWQAVVTAADEALAIDAANAEAKRLKTEAEGHLEPTLTIYAQTEDGRDVPAVVGDGRNTWKTSQAIPLAAGARYSFTISIPSIPSNPSDTSTRHAPATLAFTADWRGPQTRRVTLAEIKGPQAGDVQKVALAPGVELELVWCPAGTFAMGSPPGEAGRDDDETQHQVTLTKGFWMGKYEVTQRQWEAVMGANPSHFKNAGSDAPVESVSWNDCQEFIRKVNAKVLGGGFRLPTEAEWEYACRAGSRTALCSGPMTIAGLNNAPALDPVAWYGGNSGVTYAGGYDSSGWPEKQYDHRSAGTHPVGQKKPNDWGLYDMHGNVWEWCQDWYGGYPSGSETNPPGPGSGTTRVFRGGSWINFAWICRSANRGWSDPGFANSFLGLRLARTFDAP